VLFAGRNRLLAELGGTGLVLMPSSYIWPNIVAIIDEPWQPTIVYPARDVDDHACRIFGLSASGISGHMIALRDAGLVEGTRHGHEVRYARTALGTKLLDAGSE